VKRKVLLLEHNNVRRGIVSNTFLRSNVKVISVVNGNDLFIYLHSLIKTHKKHLIGRGYGQLTEEDEEFFPICPFDFVLINFSSLHQSEGEEEEMDDFQFIKRLNHILSTKFSPSKLSPIVGLLPISSISLKEKYEKHGAHEIRSMPLSSGDIQELVQTYIEA